MKFQRSFSSAVISLSRQSASRPPLRIRAPIAPTVKNIEVSQDHPLWQFFHDQKYLRSFEDLDKAGRPWTIPELRKKSFDDLHSLWYTCLKERNIIARELQVLSAETDQSDSQFLTLSDQVRETMWRIRHVLSERHHAQEDSRAELAENETALLDEFTEFYLNATKDEEAEIQEALKRLQFALFGISEIIEDNKVDKHFIKGLKYIANLKAQKYGSNEEILPIEDAGEAFIIFHAEPTAASVAESIEAVLKLREDGVSVDKYSEIDTIKEYLKRVLDEE